MCCILLSCSGSLLFLCFLLFLFFLMIPRPPRSTRTDTLFPYTTLFRAIFKAFSLLVYTSQLNMANAKVEIPVAINLSTGPSRTCGTGLGSAICIQLRSEEHTSELQSLMRISYAVFCLKKKKQHTYKTTKHIMHTEIQNTQQSNN